MPLRLVFMGTPDFAVPTLRALAAQGHTVVAVYTRAPKPAGRGMALSPTPVERAAKDMNFPVLSPASLKIAEAEAVFRAHNADAAVVVAYGLILPSPVLQGVKLGCFNLHASLLPRWRRSSDQSRDHGGRCRERRDRDEDGRGARYRRDGDDRARRH